MNYSKLAFYIKKIYKKKKILLHEPYLDKFDHLLVESSLKNKQLSTHGNTTEYFSEHIKKILKIKRSIHNGYQNFIKENYRNTFSIVSEPKNSKSNFWLNILKLKSPDKEEIDKIIRYLISKNIHVRPLWEPLHTLKYLKKFQTEDLKVTNKLRSQLILLPSGIDGYVK
jgi:dTDP-4-amino-4,6-dideoxygalactose transaminase